MAREFFKNLPNTTTPLTAPRLNGLLDGDEAMGNILVDTIKTKNNFNINGEINVNGFSGNIGSYNSVSNNIMTCNGNSSSSQYYGQKFTDLNNKTFTISAKLVAIGTGVGGRIAIFDGNSFKTEKQLGVVGDYQSITYTGTSNNIVIAFCTAGGTGAQLTDIQLEIGNEKTDYAEFQGVGYVSGKNTNGEYVKYDDGTLICYQTKNFTGLSFTSSGTLYKCDISSAFTFPVGFINAPTIAVQTQSDSDYSYSFVYGTRRTTTAITSIELMRIVSASNVTIPIGYIAIGRWK